jgi:hypothetical protein
MMPKGLIAATAIVHDLIVVTRGGTPLDRTDRYIATVLAGIRNSHARPPLQKEAVLRDDIIAMLETLDQGTL